NTIQSVQLVSMQLNYAATLKHPAYYTFTYANNGFGFPGQTAEAQFPFDIAKRSPNLPRPITFPRMKLDSPGSNEATGANLLFTNPGFHFFGHRATIPRSGSAERLSL